MAACVSTATSGQSCPGPAASPAIEGHDWPQRIDSIGARAISAGRLRHERRKLLGDTEERSGTADERTIQCGPQSIVSDVFFAPIKVTSGVALLSDPVQPFRRPSQESTVLSPSALTAMLARRRPARQPAAQPEPLCEASSRYKLMLSPRDLENLVIALANTTLVRSSVQVQHPLSFVGPHNTSRHSRNRACPLYSQANKQFVAVNLQEVAPYFELAGTTLNTTALIKQEKLCSSSSRSDLTNAKEPIHIVLPNGVDHAAALHVVRRPSKDQRAQIALQIVSRMTDSKKDQFIGYMSIEHDVTESFVRAAIAELAQQGDLSRDEMGIRAEDEHRTGVRDFVPENWQDWTAVIDELQAVGETNDLVDALLAKMPALDGESCTMQTLTLISELSGLCHRCKDCIIVQPKSKADSKRWHAQILQISRSMGAKLDDMDSCDGSSPTRNAASRAFLRKVCSMVVRHADMDECYSVTNKVDLIHRFNCVPLYEKADAKPYAWAVFIQPTFKHWQMI